MSGTDDRVEGKDGRPRLTRRTFAGKAAMAAAAVAAGATVAVDIDGPAADASTSVIATGLQATLKANTVDVDVSASPPPMAAGYTLISTSSTEATWQPPPSGVFYPADYGNWDPSGATDSSVALFAAVRAAGKVAETTGNKQHPTYESQGAVVAVPPGFYSMDGTTTTFTWPQGVVLRGPDRGLAVLRWTYGDSKIGHICIDASGTHDGLFEGITFRGPTTNPQYKTMRCLAPGGKHTLRRVGISNFGAGVVQIANQIKIEDCYINGNYDNVLLVGYANNDNLGGPFITDSDLSNAVRSAVCVEGGACLSGAIFQGGHWGEQEQAVILKTDNVWSPTGGSGSAPSTVPLFAGLTLIECPIEQVIGGAFVDASTGSTPSKPILSDGLTVIGGAKFGNAPAPKPYPGTEALVDLHDVVDLTIVQGDQPYWLGPTLPKGFTGTFRFTSSLTNVVIEGDPTLADLFSPDSLPGVELRYEGARYLTMITTAAVSRGQPLQAVAGTAYGVAPYGTTSSPVYIGVAAVSAAADACVPVGLHGPVPVLATSCLPGNAVQPASDTSAYVAPVGSGVTTPILGVVLSGAGGTPPSPVTVLLS